MDSQNTALTQIMREIKVLHLEPTDVCQAACPLCAREIDLTFDKKAKHHLRIEHIQRHFDDVAIAQLDKVFMCGNYGDPAAGQHTMDIYKYVRQVNPTAVLGMNTNGGIQSTVFWQQLGQLFDQPNDYCVFSIDGLEDSNHIYRKNVNWTKVISNSQAFIAAGGSAHWDMLVYKHNQHQVDACEQLARKLGFKWFRAKVSKRAFVSGLEVPIGWQLPMPAAHAPGSINCHALAENSAYIDAQGRLGPCCWQGSRQSNFVTDDLETLKMSWATDPDPICAKTCSTVRNSTTFASQWQKEIKLC